MPVEVTLRAASEDPSAEEHDGGADVFPSAHARAGEWSTADTVWPLEASSPVFARGIERQCLLQICIVR